MKTIVMDMRSGPDAAGIAKAGAILKDGGLVAFPTETVYGLGGDALNPKASEKIYTAKGRPSDNPLIVHIARFEDLAPLVTKIPDAAYQLSSAFWPGPLTMIFPKSALVPPETTGGLDSVAVRMPAHPAALALIEAGGGYVAAPSANRSGRPSPTQASHVLQDLDGFIDALIDGGEGEIGIESTIIDLTEAVPTILRPGYISQEMAQAVIGEVRMDPGLISAESTARPKAPGMKYRHYAPKGEMTIVRGRAECVTDTICRMAREALSGGARVGIISSDETKAAYRGIAPEGEADRLIVRSAGNRGREVSIAQHLYALLREFDDLGVEVIWSEAFDTPRMGQAIMNRLLKAAGHRVVDADG